MTDTTERPLPLATRFAYGFGQLGEGVKNTAFATFVVFYYNQVVGISGTLTGVALMIALIIDGVTDPLIGYLSDRSRSRFGRRHPFMLVAAVPMGLALVLVFNPPPGMSELFYFGWLLVSCVVLRLFLTLFHVPHLALGAELRTDAQSRAWLFSLGIFFSSVGAWGFAAAAYRVFFPTVADGGHGLLNAGGYLPFSLTGGVLVVASIFICVAGTWREIPNLRQANAVQLGVGSVSAFRRELVLLFRNPSFRALFFGGMCGALVLRIEYTFQAYVGVHFWSLPTEQLAYVPAAVFFGLFFSVPLALLMNRWFEKRRALLVTAVLAIVSSHLLITLRLFTDWLPANGDPVLLTLIVLVAGFGGAVGPVIFVMLLSMLGDVADEQEFLHQHRQEGMVYAAHSFASKVSTGLGGMLGGMGLDLIEFPVKAVPGMVPDVVLFKLGLVAGPLAGVISLLAIGFYLRYRIDNERLVLIRRSLTARVVDKYRLSTAGRLAAAPGPASH